MNNWQAGGVSKGMGTKRLAFFLGSIFFSIDVLALVLLLVSGFAFPQATGVLLATFVNCGLVAIACLLFSLTKK
jgi:hypothetical protein